jgi:hypothetical protein
MVNTIGKCKRKKKKKKKKSTKKKKKIISEVVKWRHEETIVRRKSR